MRWIVFSLTDDSSNELADELIKGEPLLLDETQDCSEENEDWESWQPDPIDADQSKSTYPLSLIKRFAHHLQNWFVVSKLYRH